QVHRRGDVADPAALARRRHGARDTAEELVHARMRHHPGEGAVSEFLQPVLLLARFTLLDLAAQVEEDLRDIDLDRAALASGDAQAGGEGQRRRVRYSHELRGNNGPDRSGVDPGKAVSADLAINRAGIQARAAADAEERLTLAAVGQQLGAPVI